MKCTRIYLILAIIIFSISFLFSGSLIAEEGFYIGASISYAEKKVDVHSNSKPFVEDLAIGALGLDLGYEFPSDNQFYLAGELGYEAGIFGLDYVLHDIFDVLFHGFSQRKVEMRDSIYLDLHPGMRFFSDKLILHGVVGMELSKFQFTSRSVEQRGAFDFRLRQIGTDFSEKKINEGLRLGAAVSFYPIKKLGIRVSLVQSLYSRLKFGSDNNYSIDPKWLGATVALIWKI